MSEPTNAEIMEKLEAVEAKVDKCVKEPTPEEWRRAWMRALRISGSIGEDRSLINLFSEDRTTPAE